MTNIREGAPGVVTYHQPTIMETEFPGGNPTAGDDDVVARVSGLGIYASTTFAIQKARSGDTAATILVVKALDNYVAADLATGTPASMDVIFDVPGGGTYGAARYTIVARNGALEGVDPDTFAITPV